MAQSRLFQEGVRFFHGIVKRGKNIKFFFCVFRSYIEDLSNKFLYDGPVAKPQQYSAWYRKKKSCLERELRMFREKNHQKKEEFGHYLKKWVSHQSIYSKKIFLSDIFYSLFLFVYLSFLFKLMNFSILLVKR